MSEDLKHQLRKHVFEALNNASEGDSPEAKYQDGPTDSIVHDLITFDADISEFADKLIEEALESVVEEWKALHRVSSMILNDKAVGQIINLDVDAPDYEKDEP